MAQSHETSCKALHRGQPRRNLLAEVDYLRLLTSSRLNTKQRSELGQFMTPAPVAALMASMIPTVSDEVRLLDAGAGVGSLTAAAIAELLSRPTKPKSIHVTSFEIDSIMSVPLREAHGLCAIECERAGVSFIAEVLEEDFLARASSWLSGGLFEEGAKPKFNLAIQNPPYKKMHSASGARSLAREIGIETTNLYTAFLTATLKLLEVDGQLVAISPRSFCNGPYFRPFRQQFLREMSLSRIHVFQSRQEAFKDDEVLQETVIVSARRCKQSSPVQITSSKDALSEITSRAVPFSDVVSPSDSQLFIHIQPDDEAAQLAEQMAALPCTLGELRLSVSTGRVVDFRAKDHLRQEPDAQTIPLIYPGDMIDGAVVWPRQTRKPKALNMNQATQRLTVPCGPYVVTKRFSAKEERRRVVAAVFDPAEVPGGRIGFENHLNYYHRAGEPLDMDLAKGLSAFLNTTLVDGYFRQFNGHTQVNATDLRAIRYPSEAALRTIGRRTNRRMSAQAEIDAIVQEALS